MRLYGKIIKKKINEGEIHKRIKMIKNKHDPDCKEFFKSIVAGIFGGLIVFGFSEAYNIFRGTFFLLFIRQIFAIIIFILLIFLAKKLICR
ncbi:hypothetical protein HOD61_01790 [archaeon]|jgi:hypothetical protein|nr:hypothetical protein [archaeon]